MKKIPDILKEKAIGFVFNLVSLLVIVVVLLLVIWAFAAFTEPSSAPSASNQDFAQNILGADNNNNLFASINVAANADGSIIERLENIQAKSIGTTDIGAVTGSITGSLAEMIDYLWDNRASFGSSNVWTQCAYFQDTAGDDITGTWDNGCSSYDEVIFRCDNGAQYTIGPFDNSIITDYFDFNGSGTTDNWYKGNGLSISVDPGNAVILIDDTSYGTDNRIWGVYAAYDNTAEGNSCGASASAIAGDKYWIYGR